MNASDSDNGRVREQQREQLLSLCRQGRYDEAADLAAALDDEVLIPNPCEEIADHILKTRPEEAARLYGIAVEYWISEGWAATGSGDGIWASSNRDRVSAKLERLKHGTMEWAELQESKAAPVTLSTIEPRRKRGLQEQVKLLIFSILSLIAVLGGVGMVLSGEGWSGWFVIIFFGLCAAIFLMDVFSSRK